MYQGEVDVQELDLPSFLEIAEDLSIRGLSEGNTDNFTSEEENILQNLTTRYTNNMDDEDLDIGGILGRNANNTTFEEERPSIKQPKHSKQ